MPAWLKKLGLSWSQIKSLLETEGAKNKAYDSDVDGVFDTGAIPRVTGYKTIHEDDTVHTTTSTDWVTLHDLINPDYNFRIGTYEVKYKFRTTGSATAYVETLRCIWFGIGRMITNQLSSTTSTTTVSDCQWSKEEAANVFYGSDEDFTFRLQFKTSNSSVAAEVSYERVTVTWGKLVIP